MSSPLSDPRWRDDAACLDYDPELFFPKAKRQGERMHYRDALDVCKHCPVKAECLDWAYETNDQWAVLGGMSPRQRAKTRAAWRRKKEQAA